MALQIPTPPAAVDSTVRSNVQDFTESGYSSIEDLRQLSADQLEFTLPHQVFTLGRDELANDAGLDAATPVGWRYLIATGGQPVASAETTTRPGGEQALARLTKGPFVAATAAAVDRVQALPQLTEGAFELRLLSIPALYLMALWLHPAPTGIDLADLGDLLVPLAPAPAGIAEELSSAENLLPQLAQLARDGIA